MQQLPQSDRDLLFPATYQYISVRLATDTG